jgi:hypothetical protein
MNETEPDVTFAASDSFVSPKTRLLFDPLVKTHQTSILSVQSNSLLSLVSRDLRGNAIIIHGIVA